MSREELVEWAGFERVHGPITVQDRVDAAAARIAWSLARTAGAKDVVPDDFMPDWDAPAPKEQSAESMIAVMRGIQSNMAKDKRKKRS